VPEPTVGLGALPGVRVVLVGTGSHGDASELPDVPAVEATLADLKQALIDRCGVPSTAIRLVRDPESIEDFGTPIADAAEQAEDLLLVYYVGHGLLADDGTLHLATTRSPASGQRIRVSSLPYATVRACVANSPARSRVVILDCCYSGIAVPALGSAGPQVASLARIAGAFVMTATDRHELALAPSDQRYTAFSGALLQLLAAGDPELPEVLTLEDMFQYLDRVLPAANLPRPRRMADGNVASLVVAPNPGVRFEPPRPQPVPRSEKAKVAAGECPYKGLAVFDAADERWFFGRSGLVSTTLSRLTESFADAQPLVVLGASGAGKSSLLRAGVLPALARGDLGVAGSAWWPRILFTPTADPVGELARQLADFIGTSQRDLVTVIRSAPDQVPDLLRAPGRDRLVLVVDQFEELFTPDVPVTDRRVFVQALTAAASDVAGTPAALVVLGVRADFFGQCAELPELAAALDNRPLMVRAMTRDQIREAITAPAVQSGLSVGPGLVDVLLADLGTDSSPGPAESLDGPSEEADQPDDEPGAYEPGRLPLLSHALRMTWYEQDDGTLSVAGYRRTGGIHRALAATADKVLDHLEPAGRACARQLFLRLVHIAEDTTPTRRRVSRERLLADLPDSVLGAKVLDAFAGWEARLVTVDEQAVEITHEALIRGWPTLRGWIEQDRAGLVVEQHLIDDAQDWDTTGNDAGLLYRGSRLTTAVTWADDADHRRQLPLPAQRFLVASERQEIRRKRIRTGLVIALSVMLVAALSGVVVAWTATARAVEDERAAVAGRLRLEADALLERDPITALRLAVAADDIIQDDDSRARLVETLSRSRLTGALSHGGLLVSSAESRKDSRILVTASGETVSVWEATDAARPVAVASFRALAVTSFANNIVSLALSPDGHTLAVVGGRSVYLWDLTDPARPQPLLANLEFAETQDAEDATMVVEVAFGKGGRWLAALASNGQVSIWDLADPARPTTITMLDAHPEGFRHESEGTIYSFGEIAFTHDGRTLAVTGKIDNNPYLVVWNVSRPARAVSIRVDGEVKGAGLTLAFSPDGRTIATGGEDDLVKLWSVGRRTVKPIADIPDHASAVNTVVFSPDGRTLATASNDETAMLWDVTDRGRPLRTAVLAGHTEALTAITFTSDSQAVITTSEDGTVLLWTVADPGLVAASIPLGGHTDALSGVAFSPDGHTLATSSWDHTARIWNVARAETVATLTGHTNDVFTVAFSPDGRTLATGSADHDTRLWDVSDPARPKYAATLHRGEGAITTTAFSPDGRTLAVGAWSGGLTLWDVSGPGSPRLVGEPDKHREVFGVAFSPDGKVLATGELNLRAALWRVASPTHPTEVGSVAHRDVVLGLAFSPSGNLLATASKDNTAVLWNVANPDAPRKTGVLRHNNHVAEVAFSPDGSTLATASWDRTIGLWNVVNPNRPVRVATLRGHTGHVSGVAFSRDGRTLASASHDGTARLWNVARQVEIGVDPVGYACAVTHGGLSQEQWAEYVPELAYQQTCRQAG